MKVDVIVATRNRHKVFEIRALLPEDWGFLTLMDFPHAPSTVEDAPTFAGNARKKSADLASWLVSQPGHLAGRTRPDADRLFVLADDSGLEVDALHGAPGVLSARFSACEGSSGNASDYANNVKLLRLLEPVPAERRTARFRCVLALTELVRGTGPDSGWQVGVTTLFEGACEGLIAFEPSGRDGFGYDPLFVPKGHDRSFADLGEEIKNTLSHRARAVQHLRAAFQS